MPRNRMIKPEIWSNEQYGSLSLPTRLLWLAMWNHGDDYGVIKARPRQFKIQVFGYDDEITVQHIECMVNELIRAGLVEWFEAEDQMWLHTVNFLNHQRIDKPSKTRNPNPAHFDTNNTNLYECVKTLGALQEHSHTSKSTSQSTPETGAEQAHHATPHESAETASITAFPQSLEQSINDLGESLSEHSTTTPRALSPKIKEDKLSEDKGKEVKLREDLCEANAKTPEQTLKAQAMTAIEYLNQIADRKFKHTDTNIKLVIALLKEGHTLEEIMRVVALKVEQWASDAKMSEYIRPSTLFNKTKFNQYVGQLDAAPVKSFAEMSFEEQHSYLMTQRRAATGFTDSDSEAIEGECQHASNQKH